MIVQRLQDGAALALTLAEHQGLAAQLAAQFGNDDFDALAPREPMRFAIAHHDQGWEPIDRSPPGDPATSLPCSLGATPRESLLAAAVRSVDFNERHHPFCGLLVSMHQCGLYNGRYGLQSALPPAPVAPHEQAQVDAFLRAEAERQTRLRAQLDTDTAYRGMLADFALFSNYLRLQFFDRLALYLNLAGLAHLGPAVMERVPARGLGEADVAITPLADGIALDPYPFREERFWVSYRGRAVRPQAGLADWSGALAVAEVREHRFCIQRKKP
ncbi:MAG: DUF3891 family protein [Massilia sp.]